MAFIALMCREATTPPLTHLVDLHLPDSVYARQYHIMCDMVA